MANLLFSNNAETTLADGISDFGDTITAVDDGLAGMFRSPQLADPPGTQLATLTHPDYPGEYEIVSITAREGNVFTVDRAAEKIDFEGMSPEGMLDQGIVKAWPAGTKMSARVTAGTLESLEAGDMDAPIVKNNSVVMDVKTGGYQSQAGCSEPYSLVFAGRSRNPKAIQLSGYPTLELENALLGEGYNPAIQDRNLSYSSVGGTFPVDLGTPPAWITNVVYPRGSVVRPTAANGFQYWAEADDLFMAGLRSGETEPDWKDIDATTGGVEDGYGTALGRWRPTAVPIDFEQGLYGYAVITEVGFICHKVTATTLPRISIGTAAAPGRFASDVELDQITGNGCIHRIPIVAGGALASELRYSVNTAATGGKFLGRFYWRGFYVELMT